MKTKVAVTPPTYLPALKSMAKPHPVTMTEDAAEALFGAAPPTPERPRKHVFPDESLKDPALMRAARKIVNARNYRKRQGQPVGDEMEAQYRMAASFMGQAARKTVDC